MIPGLRGLKDLKDHRVYKVLRDLWGLRDLKATMVQTAHRSPYLAFIRICSHSRRHTLWVKLETLGSWGALLRIASITGILTSCSGSMSVSSKGLKDLKDHRVYKVLRVFKVRLVLRDLRVILAIKGIKVI